MYLNNYYLRSYMRSYMRAIFYTIFFVAKHKKFKFPAYVNLNVITFHIIVSQK